VNDLSERAFQLEGTGLWVKGKSADTFGPIGPWLVTPDEILDLQNLGLWLEVDGNRYQNGSTSSMIFGVTYLVSYVSRFMSLHSGALSRLARRPAWAWARSPRSICERATTSDLESTDLETNSSVSSHSRLRVASLQ
jgi:2,4-diketo-3-deoxy-L-fuconate hydrolase